ncbi:hypothetical protein [Paenibacillus macerans]|uniref:hypothetical protein n=1 Tax=Paenibacillus macerans TaxID=44252 RepID=UPI00203C39EB|nr:hypothetical protein [Paenibacillus macerans]MCM3704032.1 hypothetical protein [Paenibacillus macerans]
MKEITETELAELRADAEYKQKYSQIARTTLKLLQQLTEKDATIKKLEQKLRIKTEEIEIKNGNMKVLVGQITDETAISAKAIVERDRLRKALEEAGNVMDDALAIGEAKCKDFDEALSPWCDLIAGIEAIDAALGEGDKE